MDRELLIEIGCEELPASWLPALTRQLGEHLAARLAALRLPPDAPVETLQHAAAADGARRADAPSGRPISRRCITGPPVVGGVRARRASRRRPRVGFARKHGVEVAALERDRDAARATYLAYRRRQRGRAAVDVLPDVLAGVLRDLAFPKQMHWDAWLDDGRGELLFGRPIRWILFLYGGRVVPFTIRRVERGAVAAGAGGPVGAP